jgi:hypothetical protein
MSFFQAIPFFLILINISCTAFQNKPQAFVKDQKLKIPFTPQDWTQVITKHSSDYAWSHQTRGDVIVVNSFCGEFQDLSLKNLALNAFTTYNDFKPLGERTLQWQKREAYELEAEAVLDGIKVLLYLRNTRRNHCYYDFLLITPRERNPSSLQDFLQLLERVSFS